MRFFFRSIVIGCASLLLGWALPAAAADALIEQFTLSNGLEVVVIPNHRVEAVSHLLCYRVGAADDPRGKSGLAHFLEHMMFRGTKAYKAGEYSRLVTREGGEHNAYTGRDYTGYYVTIAKDRLPLVMQLEADRMRGLAPDAADAAREREVIIEERRAVVDNNPSALFAEQMDAAMFQHHPYRVPVIGWQQEMATLLPADVLALHDRAYQPANAVLVVAGDITAEELKPLVEKYYGAIPAGTKMPRQWNEEPPRRVAKHITMHHAEVRQPRVVRYYAAPSLVQGEARYALPLFVLAHVLGGSDNSYLYRSLVVNQKIATEVSVGYNGFALGTAIFSITVIPAEGVSAEKAEIALDKSIADFLESTVHERALARARAQLEAESIYARDGLESMGQLLGLLRMLDLPVSFFNAWEGDIHKISTSQVMEAAKYILHGDTALTGYLLPEPQL